jgi:hypothetical protein
VAYLCLVRSMRTALAFLLMTGAVVAADKPESTVDYHGRVLDKSPRARTYSVWNTISVTKAEFRRMQQRYRPQDFDMWAKRLRQLRPGMSEKQVLQVGKEQKHAALRQLTDSHLLIVSNKRRIHR